MIRTTHVTGIIAGNGATGEIDGSPTAGFLPPEDGKGAGQGHVDYLAGTADAIAQSAAISAKATITFDATLSQED